MSTSLQEYEARIEALERGELECWTEPDAETDLIERRETTPADLCQALYGLEGEIRRIAWSAPYQAWANELRDRANREVRRLCEAHGLMGTGRAPLFEGGYIGGIHHRPIA